MEARTEALFSEPSGVVTQLAEDDGALQAARNQQRLVAEVAGQAGRIDDHCAMGLTPVAAREHVKSNAARLQEFAEQNDKWSLARTADRKIAYADHRPLQPAGGQCAGVIKRIAQANGATKNRGHES